MPSVWRSAAAVVAIALTDILLLILAYGRMPWRPIMPFWHWLASLGILAVADTMRVPAGNALYWFGASAQLPLALTHGLFPVLVVQTAIWLIGQVWAYLRLGTKNVDLVHPISAVAAPAAAVEAYLWLGKAGIPALGSAAGAVMVHCLVRWVFRWCPGPRQVVHPWQAPRWWLPLLSVLDAGMALLAWMAVTSRTPCGILMALAMTLAAILGAASYASASVYRARMQAIARLLKSMNTEQGLEELVHALLQEIRTVLACDAAVFWTVGHDLKLRPKVVVTGEGGDEVTAYLHRRFNGMRIGTGLAGFCASSRDAISVHSPRQRRWVFHRAADGLVWSSGVAAPVFVDEMVFGVIALYHTRALHLYRRPEREWLKLVCQQFGAFLMHLHKYQESRWQSQIDELTGVYNYRYFDRALHHFVEYSREVGEPVTLLIIDIDYFKQVNDRYGHEAGNQVLRQLADLLRQFVRGDDVLARYGGEEFTILMPGVSLEEGQAVADQIRMRVEETAFYVEDTLAVPPSEQGPYPLVAIHITLSIGVASYPDSADSALSLLRYADRAMYLGAKQSGRNRVSVYSPAVSEPYD